MIPFSNVSIPAETGDLSNVRLVPFDCCSVVVAASETEGEVSMASDESVFEITSVLMMTRRASEGTYKGGSRTLVIPSSQTRQAVLQPPSLSLRRSSQEKGRELFRVTEYTNAGSLSLSLSLSFASPTRWL